MAARLKLPSFARIRDTALLLLGLAIGGHEVFIAANPRWEILVFAGSLLGIPGMLLADSRFRPTVPGADGQPPPVDATSDGDRGGAG